MRSLFSKRKIVICTLYCTVMQNRIENLEFREQRTDVRRETTKNNDK